MASTFHYLLEDRVYGPVLFRELVRLVHEEVLHADQLVIANWQSEWRPAAEVVGLFHTAGRADVLYRWEMEQIEKERRHKAELARSGESHLDQFHELLAAAEDAPPQGDASVLRLQEIEWQRLESLGEERRDAHAMHTSQNQMQRTVDAALTAMTKRSEYGRVGMLKQSLMELFSLDSLHLFFRYVLAIGAANIAAICIFTWSETERLRYPAAPGRNAPARVFPYYGPCYDAEFLFLTFDAMVAAGLLGYGAARCLEALSVDEI